MLQSAKVLPKVKLSVLGTYRGGWFSRSTPTYPAYDAFSQRAFVGSDDRNQVEVIDISDPTNPTLHTTIPGSLNRLAVSQEGILAVTGSSQVRFYNANGDFHVRLSTLTLDPTAFPNASTLQQDSQLGRLRVSRVDGDTDNDGDLDEIFGFGARSFSIWSTEGNLIFDSGDDFEQITAQALPNNFNASEDENDRDQRSDDRGPESEILALGVIAGRTYAFTGFERISGIMVYDITDPAAPSFQQFNISSCRLRATIY